MYYNLVVKEKNSFIKSFSSHLFWDTDRTLLDKELHKKYIIKQVLEFGYDKDWYLLNKVYTLSQIRDCAMSIRSLDKKAASFIACITNTNLRDYKCYTTIQSNNLHWIY